MLIDWKINIKMTMLPKRIYRFSEIPVEVFQNKKGSLLIHMEFQINNFEI